MVARSPDERFDIIAGRKAHEVTFVLWPAQWRRFPRRHNLRWRSVRFIPANQARVPKSSGVYAFVVEPRAPGQLRARYLCYVGKASSLRSRYSSYVRDLRGSGDPRARIYYMFRMWPNHIHFIYAPLDRAVIADAETALVVAHWPPMNDEILGDLLREGRAFR
jgi:hypothetical protein